LVFQTKRGGAVEPGARVSARRERGRPSERFDLSELNQPQRDAVLHDGGPLLVLAGAGSGKTRVIIYRIARLLRDGVPPDNILGLTFTNKAAKEMRQRLAVLCGADAGKVMLSTFHALGLSILKAENEAAGLGPRFTIYDTSDQLSLVRELMRQVKVADRRLDASRVLDLILKTKRSRLAEVPIDWGDDYELAAFDLYPRYVEQMRAYGAIDFDDLILRTEDVLRLPEVRARWGERYEELLVDEYQDTSPDQLELVRVLAGAKKNLCVVGDDDQSIYGWRGAAADNILLFAKHFAGAREVILDQNYRSTTNILAAANAVITHNAVRKQKSLWSAGGPGEPVEIVACDGDEDEASFAIETIGRLVYDSVPHDDIAVLYRSNMQSQILEEALALERIPFRVVGGQAFFDRKEVRDALAYLALAYNPQDEIALRRVINTPPRGIGPASLERLSEHALRTQKGLWWALRDAASVPDLPTPALAGAQAFAEIMAPEVERAKQLQAGELAGWAEGLFERLGVRQAILDADDAPTLSARRLDNLKEVVGSLARYAQSNDVDLESALGGFLRAAALVGDDKDDADAKRGRVTLMTLHSAKGLEFPYVMMVGVEEELLPHKRTMELGGDLSEERRLCYVGITRARRRLWMSYARRRLRNGKPVERTPSRFLQEIPDGDGVRRRDRKSAEKKGEDSEQMAADFFKKMRAQLGMDDVT
jgi:DNA helicase II / ATP-dependent DNA helicase PcrA